MLLGQMVLVAQFGANKARSSMTYQKNGRWHFSVSLVDRVPPRIGRGQDGDPIYPIISEEIVAACRSFYTEVKAFLAGQRDEPPSISCLSGTGPHGSIRKIEGPVAADDVYGPKALVSVYDEDRPSEREERRPRWIDPEYVPAILMLTAPGGSLRFNDSTSRKTKDGVQTPAEARRFFLSFGRGQDQNIRVTRIISNPRTGLQVHRRDSRLNRLFHYDLRRNSLEFKSDESMPLNRYSAGFSVKGRSEAIKTAGAHYSLAQKREGKEKIHHLGATRAAFERELKEVFELADQLHTELTRRRRETGNY
jgi:hypothetical protein